jgi:hypothetical protein
MVPLGRASRPAERRRAAVRLKKERKWPHVDRNPTMITSYTTKPPHGEQRNCRTGDDH